MTVVFDNSDRRLSTSAVAGTRDEVTIRRVVGSKKDEHFINDKSVSRSDVQSLLEAAGFSRHNPYFMVEQGKVTDLSVMRDDARMELLKRVAGTDVYEHRRKEALRILGETERRREGIAEVVSGIDERLGELERERSELEHYRELDTQRRALQYTLHQEQLQKATAEAAGTEDALADVRERVGEQQFVLDGTRAAVEAAMVELRAAEARCAALRSARDDLERERREAASAAVRLEEEVRALEQDVEADSRTEGERAAALEAAEGELREAERVLREVHGPALAEAEAAHGAASSALRLVQRREEGLLARQGRSAQFKTASARDKWLRKEAGAREDAAAEAEARAATAAERTASLRASAAAARKAAAKQQETASTLARHASEDLEPTLRALRRDVQRAGAERGSAMADLAAIERDRAAAEAGQEEAERRLYKAVPAAVRVGLSEAARLVTEEGLVGVHGPLVELVGYAEHLDTAVEEVAGKQLFNLVVDDEAVAARIVRHLQRSGRGRVTCMPLSRLRGRAPPDLDAAKHPDVTPLAAQLEYPADAERAVREVFGSVLLCKDHDTASRYARPEAEGGLGMDCVTVDGFRRNADGSIFGGYVDRVATRSRAERARRDAGVRLAAAAQAGRAAQEAAAALDAKLSKLRGKEVEVANEGREATARSKQLRVDAEASRARADAEEERAEEEEREGRAAAAAAEAARAEAAALGEEVGTPMTGELSAAERAELTACSREGESARAAVLEAARELEARHEARAAVEGDAEGRLRPAVAHLRKQLSGSAGGTGGADIETRRSRLPEARAESEAAAARLRDTSARLAACEEDLVKEEAPVEAARTEAERLRSAEVEQQEALSRMQGESERLWRHRSQATETRGECEARLRELGTLPEEAMRGLAGTSRSRVMKRLKAVGRELAAYGHVNKKALRQWETFSEQRKGLEARRAECEGGAASIHATVRHLDTEKDKAILRTFRGVAMHFRKVFGELVPQGKASMVLVADDEEAAKSLGRASASPSASSAGAAADRRSVSREIESDSAELTALEERVVTGSGRKAGSKRRRGRREEEEEQEDDEEHDDEAEESSLGTTVSSIAARRSELDQYRGVAIKASFAAGEASKRIELYSGGQKTMLAIALLLAIQRCDPAPFYLFDEVDQALDSTYRTALADVIKRQAADADHPAQFLTISFRTEVIAAADKHFVLEPGYVTRLTGHSPASALAVAERICEEEAARSKHGAGSARRRSRSRSRSVARDDASDAGTASKSATPSRRAGARAAAAADEDEEEDDRE